MLDESGSANKDADLLAGDAISNYKTVISLAREDEIVNDYRIRL